MSATGTNRNQVAEADPWRGVADNNERRKRIAASEDVPSLTQVVRWPDNAMNIFLAADARLKKLRRIKLKEAAQQRGPTTYPVASPQHAVLGGPE